MWKVCNTSTIHILRSLLWPIIKPGVKWNIPYTRPLNLHTYCYLLPSLRFYRSLSLPLSLYPISLLFRHHLILSFLSISHAARWYASLSKLLDNPIIYTNEREYRLRRFYRLCTFYCFSRIFSTWYLIWQLNDLACGWKSFFPSVCLKKDPVRSSQPL